MHEEDEVGKYRKKSSKSTPKKSKHYYESCVFGYYAKKFTKERWFVKSVDLDTEGIEIL